MQYDFKEVIDNFLERQEKDSAATYRKKILVFYDYVTGKKDATNINFVSILKNLNIDEIMDSVVYYVKENEIKYISTTDIYISTIKSFFLHIAHEYNWINPFFEEKKYSKEFSDKYKIKMEELKLNAVKQVEPLKENEAKKLIVACDRRLEDINLTDLVNGVNNGVFSGYISALISKMVLFYGLSNKSIVNLKYRDYDDVFRKITINGFQVHLPDLLGKQLHEYIELRKEFLKSYKENELLFIDFANPSKSKMDNTKMFFILKEVIGTNQATALAKYAIIQMIRANIPTNLIMEFTGYKKDIYNHCQEIVDEEKGIILKSEKNKVLDLALRQSRLCDYM